MPDISPRERSGMVSIANDDATPQIPPIATPYSTRNSKRPSAKVQRRKAVQTPRRRRYSASGSACGHIFRRSPKDQRAYWPHRQREKNGQRDLLQADVKGLCDIAEQEYQHEKSKASSVQLEKLAIAALRCSEVQPNIVLSLP